MEQHHLQESISPLKINLLLRALLARPEGSLPQDVTEGNNLSNFSNLSNRLGIIRKIYAKCIGKPEAGVVESPVLGVHDEVNGSTTGIAYVTAVAVAGGGECERGTGVVVEGAEGLVTADGEAESRGDLLDRKVLELLNIGF